MIVLPIVLKVGGMTPLLVQGRDGGMPISADYTTRPGNDNYARGIFRDTGACPALPMVGKAGEIRARHFGGCADALLSRGLRAILAILWGIMGYLRSRL
jgi:hypothetical protein